ncbi:hypothetical protein D1013_16670 [Euzebyella marina]|uniref:Uncharacterized protein n=1 Tax=Euzebyella marina TaxID=1761453 RepID=A0A3G2L9F3_9FLAO|nr:hypothetical protein D1013_16670 [Euzebyella marina]
MVNYYVNDTPQLNGDHEVHAEDCRWLKVAKKTTLLGYHSNCHSAVSKAKYIYAQSNGCRYCCQNCHTS